MQTVLIFALVVGSVWGQALDNDTRAALEDLFPISNTTTTNTTCSTGICIPGLVPVETSTSSSSKGYLEKCGEGSQKGKRMCVNYEYCNPVTNTIVQNGLTAGFGVINIRIGDSECEHNLELCCNIPEGGLSPGFDPNVKPTTTTTPSPTVTTAPITEPPVTQSGCGIRNPNGIDFKITGNSHNETEYGEFPWMVAIMKKISSPSDTSFSFCGGAIISPYAILTAAHCVFTFRERPNEIKIRAGEWDSETVKERLPYQERNVAKIIIRKDYVTAGVFNDLALLVLDRPLDTAQHISSICLPKQGQVIQSKNCFVTGWGKDVFGVGGKFQHILKKIELPIVPIPQCQALFRQTALGRTYIIHESFICAGGEKGKDACTGDGGSPLMCPDPTNPNRYLLAGLVSWGLGCGEQDIPGAYTDVAKFRSWTDQQMQLQNLDTSSYIP